MVGGCGPDTRAKWPAIACAMEKPISKKKARPSKKARLAAVQEHVAEVAKYGRPNHGNLAEGKGWCPPPYLPPPPPIPPPLVPPPLRLPRREEQRR